MFKLEPAALGFFSQESAGFFEDDTDVHMDS